MSTVTGVDAQGCVLTLDNVAFQPEFEPLLADVIASLSQSGLDGIYVYGSVARGEASPGESDLDLSLILLEPPDASVLAHLQALRQSLEQRHPEVTKIDFDIGHRAEVLAPENANKWGFWLKHHCRCVWGEDLSLRFERFQPSREIALVLNGDFESVLSGYLNLIHQANTSTE
ncbi:nucleotidyltransferase domain-containing protein, partial [Pseudomonas salomonii]